jgi:hypothetical protein
MIDARTVVIPSSIFASNSYFLSKSNSRMRYFIKKCLRNRRNIRALKLRNFHIFQSFDPYHVNRN